MPSDHLPGASFRPWGGPWAAYTRGALPDDLIAALIVTVLLVPQSLAYAMLAGLPPVVGVMASLLPVLAYAVLGTGNTLAVGPVAVLSMMTVQAVVPAAQAHGVTPHGVALVLAVQVGALLLIAAWLRLDVLAALLSVPVLHGFVTGASIAIAMGQLAPLLGMKVQGQTLVELLRHVATQGLDVLTPHATTASFGLLALVALVALRKWAAPGLRRLGVGPLWAGRLGRMAPVSVVLLAIVAMVGVLGQGGAQGVALAGTVDLAEGLRFVPPWHAPWALWAAMLPVAALIALVGYVESLAVAEALAARRGEAVIPRRELFGLGAANLVAGVSGGQPVAGSFSRSVVHFDAGARTRMAGVWTALLLALAVWLLGHWLQFLPKAVLAATIIVAVLSLVDFAPFGHARHWSRMEWLLMVGVAALVVLLGVTVALAVGVVASVLLLLQRTARPHWAEVGRLPGTAVFRNVDRFQVQTQAQVMSVRVDEGLLFTNSRWLVQTLVERVRQRPGVRHLVLMMSGVNDIDFTGLEGLQHLARDLRVHGVMLHLSELKGPMRDRLDASDTQGWLTGQVFATHQQAWEAMHALEGVA